MIATSRDEHRKGILENYLRTFFCPVKSILCSRFLSYKSLYIKYLQTRNLIRLGRDLVPEAPSHCVALILSYRRKTRI